MDGSTIATDVIDNNPGGHVGMSPELRILEAILFAATEPVTEKALQDRLPEGIELSALLRLLQEHYEGRGVNLVQVAGRWAFRTAADLGESLEIEIPVTRKLGRATVETLAIIAYHQPITRAEIEEIRGVSLSKGTLDQLLEIGWIKPVGRRRTPGRPVTWGTSMEFLSHFNLNQVGELPGIDELKAAGLLDKRPSRTIFGEVAVHQEIDEGLTNSEQDEIVEPLNVEG